MTGAEREALEEHRREVMGDHQAAFDALGWMTSGTGMATASVALILLASAWYGFPGGTGPGSMLAVIYIVLAGMVRKPIGLFCRMLDELRQDLARGEVLVRPVEARAVVVITPRDEAELPAYVFDLGGRNLLYMEASDLRNLSGGSSDPHDRFEIVDAPVSGTCLGIVPSGEPLVPERTIGPLTATQSSFLEGVDRFFPGDLSSLDELLGK